MKRLLTGVFILLLSTSSVIAQTSSHTVADMVKDKTGRLLIGQTGVTYFFVNSELERRKQPKFYCTPKDLRLKGDDYATILASWVIDKPAVAKEDSNAMPSLMLNALRAKWPCP